MCDRLFGNIFAKYEHGIGEKNKTSRQTYKERYTCVPNCDSDNGGPPYFTVINTIIIVVCFCVYNVGKHQSEAEADLIASKLIYNGPTAEVWRYFTYSFLHANTGHIVGNMIAFWLVCPLLEMGQDSLRPLGVYIVGTILGPVFTQVLNHSTPDQITPLVGASGGINALVFAHVANVLLNADNMRKSVIFIKMIILAPLLGTTIIQFYYAYTQYILHEDDGQRISYAAHISGAITGLFFGSVMLRNYEQQKWEKTLGYVFLGIFVMFIGVCITFICM